MLRTYGLQEIIGLFKQLYSMWFRFNLSLFNIIQSNCGTDRLVHLEFYLIPLFRIQFDKSFFLKQVTLIQFDKFKITIQRAWIYQGKGSTQGILIVFPPLIGKTPRYTENKCWLIILPTFQKSPNSFLMRPINTVSEYQVAKSSKKNKSNNKGFEKSISCKLQWTFSFIWLMGAQLGKIYTLLKGRELTPLRVLFPLSILIISKVWYFRVLPLYLHCVLSCGGSRLQGVSSWIRCK